MGRGEPDKLGIPIASVQRGRTAPFDFVTSMLGQRLEPRTIALAFGVSP
jgi:hypothetical protein